MTDSKPGVVTHRCSFCGKSNVEVRGTIIAGPGVAICQECVFGCVEIIFQSNAKKTGASND